MEDPLPPPSISLTPEHYNRVVRLVRHGQPATLEVEVEAQMHTDDLAGANVVAEILGSERADELVMIGAHYDDVVYATGATDNAAGCAVMMEVMRILKALELPLDRTVRMVLWTGEEEGLLGSKAYVKEHFGDPRTMELTAEQEKVSAYYNLDNGTGKIRGVYLQGNDMVRPIFNDWLGPFKDHGASTLTIRNTGGTDHLSFDAVGIPGFQFIQDPVEYWSITHHSNMDVYDRVVPADLMQAAAIIATFVYQTANRDEMMPRKPLPEPWPENLQDLEN
jgi:Zn-dependent M28 family amino/carboxypeptidase